LKEEIYPVASLQGNNKGGANVLHRKYESVASP
jgi:hypothetical protein